MMNHRNYHNYPWKFTSGYLRCFLYLLLFHNYKCSCKKETLQNESNARDNELVVLLNKFALTRKDINTIQTVYKNIKNENISLENIDTIIKIYYYLCYMLSIEEVRNMLSEELPEEVTNEFSKHTKIINTLVLLWNKDTLYRIISDMASSDEQNLKTEKKQDFFWQYIMISGKYTNRIPKPSDFTFLMQTNFTPEEKLTSLKKKYGLKNLKISFNTFQEWDRKNFIDKKNKTFSIIINKSKMYTNIRYEIILYDFFDVQKAVDGFQVIQNNSSVLPEQVPNLMKYKNMKCKMIRTVIYSQEDSGFAAILSNLPINQYNIIDNSYYVIYITNKSYCEENQETKEERKTLLTKEYIDNILKRLDNKSLKILFEKLDKILYA